METFKAIGEKLKTATNGGFVVDTDEVKKNIVDIVNPLSTKFNETVAYANNEINATAKKWQSSTSTSSSSSSSQQSQSDDTTAVMLITLRITGLGHNMTLKDLPSTTMTMAELMTKIYNSAGLIPRYQRLIGPRGLKIDSNNDNDNGGGGGDEKTLFEIGIKDRTKLILMHSPLYTNEKDSYEKLIEIEKEINDLKSSILIRESNNDNNNNNNNNNNHKPIVVSEMVTRICCKLDLVDTVGSTFIRSQRKELIKKAEGLETIL
jgi:hypothetical protein